MLKRMIRKALSSRNAKIAPGNLPPEALSVLNVGGGNKGIPIPAHFAAWNHILLDVAPGPDVDLVLDARRLETLDADQFNAVYCSHNLEHYYRHDCERVLAGFQHVLKSNGFAEIRVPDMTAVFQAMVSQDLDIDDVLYTSPAGPITVHDVIYGWHVEIERSGVEFYAHKRGFTVASLTQALLAARFEHVLSMTGAFEIRALAFKSTPTDGQRSDLRI